MYTAFQTSLQHHSERDISSIKLFLPKVESTTSDQKKNLYLKPLPLCLCQKGQIALHGPLLHTVVPV